MHETHLLGKIVLEMIENTEHSKSEILIPCCHNQIRINYILYLIIIITHYYAGCQSYFHRHWAVTIRRKQRNLINMTRKCVCHHNDSERCVSYSQKISPGCE